MWTTILLAILLIAAVGAFIVSRRLPKTITTHSGLTGRDRTEPNPVRAGFTWGSIAAAVVFALVFVLSTFVVVSTRNIGVVTTFGKPVGNLSNGLHFTWPWQSVTEMDGAIQIDWHKDEDPNGDNHGGAIVVRLGNNSNAWADTSVRWEMKQEAAEELFLQYRDFDNIRTNLVTRNLQTAMNEVFGSYNPLATVNAADPDEAPAPPTESQLPVLAASVVEKLKAKVGNQIEVYEVQIPTIAFDGNTQSRIDELNVEKAKTAVALQSQQTAREQARANATIAASINNDPNVLVNKCLDVVKEKGGSVFGCWPGTQALPTVPVPAP